MKKQYSFNPVTATLTITKEFSQKMIEVGSDERNLYLQLKADFPNIKIVKRTHKRPSQYVNKNGEVSRSNQFKNLKYENMEKFMKALSRSEEYIKEYEFLKNIASCLQYNGYKLVREWFEEQFPYYRTNPLFYAFNDVEVLSAKEFAKKRENVINHDFQQDEEVAA